VKYEISGTLEEMHHCHCSRCRKAHGAAFSTFARTSVDRFGFVSGEPKVRALVPERARYENATTTSRCVKL